LAQAFTSKERHQERTDEELFLIDRLPDELKEHRADPLSLVVRKHIGVGVGDRKPPVNRFGGVMLTLPRYLL
jgi:hypothetical protein